MIFTLIERLGNKLTEPQYEFLNWLLMNIEYETGTSLIEYIKILVQRSNTAAQNKRNKSTNGSLIIQVWSTRPGDYYPLAVGNVWTYSDVKNRKNKIVFEIIDKIQIQLEKDKTVSSYVLSKYDPNLPEYAPNLDDPANPDQKWRIYNFSYLGRKVDENLTPTEILQYAQNVTSGTVDTIMFEPFLSLYRFPLIPGNRWQQSFQAKLTPELFPIGGGSDEFEVISEEDLNVAAGIFNNVFQIQ